MKAKAIIIHRFGTTDVLNYDTVEIPAPGRGELLVRVAASGAGFGDVMLRNGQYPAAPPFPVTLGFDASGTVEAIGDTVADSWLGQRVMVVAPNCNAEYVVCPAVFATPLSDRVSDEAAAAAATNYTTAYHLLHTVSRAEKGESLLVYAAAGGVGSALVQLGKLAGHKVIGLTSTKDKCEFVLNQGADHVINYNSDDVAGRIREYTDGKGIDLVMNSVAGDTLDRDFEIAAPLGRIILLGMSAGPPASDLTAPFLENFGKSLSVQFFGLATLAMNFPEKISKSLEVLAGLLAENRIKPRIHEVLPLSETARAHQMIESARVMGKVILKP